MRVKITFFLNRLTVSSWNHRTWRWRSWNSSIPWWIFRRKNADWRLRLKIWLRCHIRHISRHINRRLLYWWMLGVSTHSIIGWFSIIIGIINRWSGVPTLCNTSSIIMWYWGIKNVQVVIGRVVDSSQASVCIYSAFAARTSRIPSISTANKYFGIFLLCI